MSDTTIEQTPGGEPVPAAAASDEQLVAVLVDRARSEGLQLTGEGRLLQPVWVVVMGSRPLVSFHPDGE